MLFPYDPVHQTFVNVYEDGALRHQAILDVGRTTPSTTTPAPGRAPPPCSRVFVPAGIEHILIGPDHVLFLIGLLLLGGSLWQLGHDRHGVHDRPQHHALAGGARRRVAPGEHHRAGHRAEHHLRRAPTTCWSKHVAAPPNGDNVEAPRDIRPLVAAVFGLVHGFGFASVLKEFGLPITALGWSLFSFNFGVEIGQLVIVLVVAWTLRAVRRRSEALSRRLVIAGSVVVMAAGGYWFIQRVFFGGGA